jgi:2-keto-4-pentenoate hydratase
MPGIGPEEGAGGRVFGYLTSQTVLTDRSRMAAGSTVGLCAEVELTVEVGRDLPDGADTAAGAVAGLAVALEIVDVDEHAAMHDIMEADAFHRAVTFRPLRPAGAPTSVSARLVVDGQTRATTTAQIDPARTVRDMGRLLGAAGHRLRAGDRIIGGSLIHLPIDPAHHIVAAIDGLGETSLYVDH